MSKKTYSIPAPDKSPFPFDLARDHLGQMRERITRDVEKLLMSGVVPMVGNALGAISFEKTDLPCYRDPDAMTMCKQHHSPRMLNGACEIYNRRHPPRYRIEQWIAAVQLRNMPIPFVALVERSLERDGEADCITITATVCERDAGALVDVISRVPLHSREEAYDRNWIRASVRACIASMLAHELDEAWIDDGKRIFDPHTFPHRRLF